MKTATEQWPFSWFLSLFPPSISSLHTFFHWRFLSIKIQSSTLKMVAACYSETHRFTSRIRVDFRWGYVRIVQVSGYLLIDYTVVLYSKLHYEELTRVQEPVERVFALIRRDLRHTDMQPNLNPRETDCLNHVTGSIVNTVHRTSRQWEENMELSNLC
jgi:hypothetical protein